MSEMLSSALDYHAEGLNVIPVKYKEKAPAIKWDEFKVRRSTTKEVRSWFGNGHHYNIGLVHGKFEDMPYYAAIDIDQDQGAYDKIKKLFPGYATGRIEQSGSGKGFHIPLWVEERPPWGDRGNKTWKTDLGNVNIRLNGCQTVAPPSIHPTGNAYRFVQDGDIGSIFTLEPFIGWLDNITPDAAVSPPPVEKPLPQSVEFNGETLKDAVQGYWRNCLQVFAHFGMADDAKEDRGGELRLLGNGGLLITSDHQQFYIFSDEFGGGAIEAWAYCRMGNTYDKHKDFYNILCEMAHAAGIDIEVYKRKFKQAQRGNTQRWTNKYRGAFSRLRGGAL
jgi:hypothetical protein